jgi:hypothetical protein
LPGECSGIRFAMTRVFMRDREHVIRLVGETAREAGTLIFVLVPLDATFGNGHVSGIVVGAPMLAGLLLIAFGIMLETKQWTKRLGDS